MFIASGWHSVRQYAQAVTRSARDCRAWQVIAFSSSILESGRLQLPWVYRRRPHNPWHILSLGRRKVGLAFFPQRLQPFLHIRGKKAEHFGREGVIEGGAHDAQPL